MKPFLKRYLVDPLLTQLRQGTSPKELAFCVALGGMIGIFPVIGSTTALCALAAILFKLNQPTIQAVNYVVYPLQWLLLIPWYRAGEWLFREEPMSLSLVELKNLLLNTPLQAIHQLWTVTWHAIIVWLLIAPIVIGIVQIVLKGIFEKIRLRPN